MDLTTATSAELGQAIRDSRKTGDRALRFAIEAELDRRARVEAEATLAKAAVTPVERVNVPASSGKAVQGKRVPKWVSEGGPMEAEAYRRQLEDQKVYARDARQRRREFTGVSIARLRREH